MPKSYVLLTAAKNEADYIGDTIASVLRQSVRPSAWFIMDDGSTDRTAEIVKDFARKKPFIRLQSAGERAGRNFGSQYKAIQAAYELAKDLKFDCVGVHDADIAPERNDYYQAIMAEFDSRPRLGIAGGFIYERANGIWKSRKGNSRDSVAGGIQMFRRECFEQIRGYTPLFHGGSDWLAQIEARMAGWEILARKDLAAYHYRPSSTANGRLRGLFRMGQMDASFGSHPLFEAVKCGRRIQVTPFLVGSIVRYSGYLSWKLSGRGPSIPAEKAAFLRKEQMEKLKRMLVPAVKLPRSATGKSAA